jgi:hypothetical protein
MDSVEDPHHLDADPDADPDSTYHPNADPDDSDFYMMRIRILFDSDADLDPNSTFHPDADPDLDPDPSFHIEAQTHEKVLK